MRNDCRTNAKRVVPILAWARLLSVLLWASAVLAGDPSDRAKAAPAGAGDNLLCAGQTLVLKVRAVIPCDTLSPGERVLNGRPPLLAGDRFIAEVMRGAVPSGILLGGTVTRIHPPQTFRRPGHLQIALVQLVQTYEGSAAPRAVSIDLNDHRLSTRLKRQLVNVLFGFEGAGIGAAVGAQLAQGNAALIGGGAGIGLLAGLGYAAVQHGAEASLQPGDTFRVTVGKCSYRPLPAIAPFTIYAPELPVRK